MDPPSTTLIPCLRYQPRLGFHPFWGPRCLIERIPVRLTAVVGVMKDAPSMVILNMGSIVPSKQDLSCLLAKSAMSMVTGLCLATAAHVQFYGRSLCRQPQETAAAAIHCQEPLLSGPEAGGPTGQQSPSTDPARVQIHPDLCPQPVSLVDIP